MTTDACSLQFIGNATTLLRFGPFTLLTDPNFLHRGQRAYLGHGLWSRRRVDPALQIADLPPLDAVVLSHMHGDHWDRVVKRSLDHDLPVYTTPAAARALRRQGFGRGVGMTTWATETLEKDGRTLRITAMPGRHARGVARHLLPPVMGSMIEYEPAPGELAQRLYITGDTLFVEDLREIPQRFPGPDVAVVHLGGTTLPGGIKVTMDGEEGADLVQLVRPGAAIPVHFDDYGRFRSPLSDFVVAMKERDLEEIVACVRRGETRVLPGRARVD
jgi:L-ascorbate metabolism protein UlaG (beta-lactamase superfamily)